MKRNKKNGEFQTLETRTFGDFSRYKVEKCRDRFGDIVYIVLDAERPDPETCFPGIIRQDYDLSLALAGLHGSEDVLLWNDIRSWGEKK